MKRRAFYVGISLSIIFVFSSHAQQDLPIKDKTDLSFLCPACFESVIRYRMAYLPSFPL